jgi:hypothetical protein
LKQQQQQQQQKNAVNIPFDLSDNYFFLFEKKKKRKQSWMVKCSNYGESTALQMSQLDRKVERTIMQSLTLITPAGTLCNSSNNSLCKCETKVL